MLYYIHRLSYIIAGRFTQLKVDAVQAVTEWPTRIIDVAPLATEYTIHPAALVLFYSIL
jgi:hypothetical protein